MIAYTLKKIAVSMVKIFKRKNEIKPFLKNFSFKFLIHYFYKHSYAFCGKIIIFNYNNLVKFFHKFAVLNALIKGFFIVATWLITLARLKNIFKYLLTIS